MKTGLILSCFAIWISGQWPASDKLTLARFERRIEDGKLADVENDLLKYVIANPKDAQGFALMAKLRLKQDRLNESKSLSLKALMLEPELLSAKLSLAAAQFQLGETQESRAVLDAIVWNKRTGDLPGLELAQMYVLVGECPKALGIADKLSLKTRNNDALPLRATCYWQSGDAKNFDTLMPVAKALAGQHPSVAVKFAEVLSKAGRPKEMADLLRLVVAAWARNADALLLLAKAEILLKDFAKAKAHLEQAEKIEPVSAELFFAKGILESEQGNYTGSLGLLERSLAGDPNNTEALRQFVITSMRANQAGKAVRAADKLIALKPDDLEFLYLYGAASLQNNDLQNAENALEKFLSARPSDARGCLALGLTFAAQPDRLTEARRQLGKCLETNPNHFEAAYQLGLSYKAQGDSAKAIEYLELAVTLSPDYASALRDLGAVYLRTGGEAKARPVLEKAAALNPNDADTHFQLSRLYNLIGEPELAKKHLKIFQDLSKVKNGSME
ncbi:MAG: tetratricopeptide repeat protein [Acidobacteriota bacterium]